MTERSNWTVLMVALLGLGVLSRPSAVPDRMPSQSQARAESGVASNRNEKPGRSEPKVEVLEKSVATLNERETALQKVGEYFGERDLFITDEDLKKVILASNSSIADANDLSSILPQIHRRMALLGKLEVSNPPTRFLFQPEMDKRMGRYCIKTSIITIPDPESSHFAYMFDRQIESIKRAAEQHGFLLDRFWLPWERTLERSAQSKDSASEKVERLRRKRDEPGVLIFRREYEKHLFVAFLVGETPTSGINKEAFARAVEYHARLCETDPNSDRQLRIVAPVYSGAYPSLEMAIQECQRRYRGRSIHVYNGSALNPMIPEQMNRLRSAVHYHSSVIDLHILKASFAYYASETLSIPKDRVAFLNEATSFGIPQELQETEPTGTNRFTLPMHLSRIRAAYESQPGMRIVQRLAVRGLTRETLELHTEETSSPTDTIADYSAMTSESEELVLANLLIHISRGNYQLIVITMTDARDVMFLNRMIEKYCPNVRTATLLSDAIYSHPDYLHLLHGMLVVSHYPLFTLPTPKQSLSLARSGPTQQFPSASSHGIYSAMTKLLTELASPIRPSELPDETDETLRAPWLGVVSYQGIWPVTVLPVPDSKGTNLRVTLNVSAKKRTKEVRARIEDKLLAVPPLPLLPWLVFIGFCVSAGLHSMSLLARWGQRLKHWPLGECFRLPKLSSVIPDGPQVANAQVAYGLVGLLMLVMAIGLVGQLLWPTSSTIAGVLLAASLILTLLSPPQVWPSRTRPLLVLTIVVLAGFIGAGFLWYRSQSDSGLLLYRLVNLSNGVTPITPFLLLLGAGYLGSMSQSVRLSIYCHHKHVRYPFAPPHFKEDLYLCPCLGRFEGISNALGRFWINKWILCSSLAVVAAPCIYVRKRYPVMTFEGWWFDAVMLIGLGAGTLVFAIGLVRLLHLWIDVHHILRRLELHPMREAFSAIGSRLSWKSIWLISDRHMSALMALEYLRRLTESGWQKTLTAKRFDAIRGNVSQMPWKDFAADLETCRRLAEDARPLSTEEHSEKLHPHLYNAAGILVQNLFLPIWRFGVAKTDESKEDKAGQDKSAPLVRRLEAVEAQVNTEVDLKAARVASADLNVTPIGTGGYRAFVTVSEMVPSQGNLATAPYPVEDCLEWLRIAERFLAVRFSSYLRPILLHLRNTIAFVTAGYLLLLVCIASYPFQPRRLLLTICSVMLVVLVGSVMWVLIQMQRDPILSRLSGTTAGKLNWNEFIFQVLTYGVLPTVSLLATLFPTLGSGFLSWLEPVMRVFR